MKRYLTFLFPRSRRGFSLVEMMTAVAIFSMVMSMVFQMLERTTTTFKVTKDSVSEFKDARNAFEAITRKLSQASLNTYWTIETSKALGAGKVPVAQQFRRMSEMHFVSGPVDKILGQENAPAGAGARISHCLFFQSPSGVTQSVQENKYRYGSFQNLINSWGYFVEFNADTGDRPTFLNNLKNPPDVKARFRLMEFMQTGESSMIGRNASEMNQFLEENPDGKWAKDQTYSWFKNSSHAGVNYVGNYPSSGGSDTLDVRNTRVLAENILALIVLPTNTVEPQRKGRLAPDFMYDSRAWLNNAQSDVRAQRNSRNQLPPIVEVVMLAVDESAMKRINKALQIITANDYSKYHFMSKYDRFFRSALLLEKDLTELRDLLSTPTGSPKLPITFRVFRSTVRIRESRWGGGGADSALAESE